MHKILHLEESPHKCPVCSRSFNQRSNLKTHLLTHTDHKPYECNSCGKVFRRNCDLRRHALTHAVGDVPPDSLTRSPSPDVDANESYRRESVDDVSSIRSPSPEVVLRSHTPSNERSADIIPKSSPGIFGKMHESRSRSVDSSKHNRRSPLLCNTESSPPPSSLLNRRKISPMFSGRSSPSNADTGNSSPLFVVSSSSVCPGSPSPAVPYRCTSPSSMVMFRRSSPSPIPLYRKPSPSHNRIFRHHSPSSVPIFRRQSPSVPYRRRSPSPNLTKCHHQDLSSPSTSSSYTMRPSSSRVQVQVRKDLYSSGCVTVKKSSESEVDSFRVKLPPEPPDLLGSKFITSPDQENLQSLNLTINRSFKTETLSVTLPVSGSSSGKDDSSLLSSPSFLNPPPPSSASTAAAASSSAPTISACAQTPKKHGFSIEEIMRR